MDRAEFYLMRCLDSIQEQTYKNIEVIITDNSPDDSLWKIIKTYSLPFFYSRNKQDVNNGIGQNTNEAINRSDGELIKILYMDDYFAHKDALADIETWFDGHWLFTATDNNSYPYYTEDIYEGNNKLGSPSAMTILNDNPLMFDVQMNWLLDCDYYKRMYDKFGEPVILRKVNVNIGVHDGQMTNTLSSKQKEDEERLMKERYA